MALLWDGTLLAIVRTIDLRRGELLTETAYRTEDGISSSGKELRLVSQADRSVATRGAGLTFRAVDQGIAATDAGRGG